MIIHAKKGYYSIRWHDFLGRYAAYRYAYDGTWVSGPIIYEKKYCSEDEFLKWFKENYVGRYESLEWHH